MAGWPGERVSRNGVMISTWCLLAVVRWGGLETAATAQTTPPGAPSPAARPARTTPAPRTTSAELPPATRTSSAFRANPPSAAESNRTLPTSGSTLRETGEVIPWHLSLVRDRTLELRLKQALRQLEDDESVTTGLTSLQLILNRDEDSFVRIEGDAVPAGAQQWVARILSGLPPETLKLYQTLYGREAERALQDALKTNDPHEMGRVIRRFYHTPAGFAAADWLATREMDQAAYLSAAAYWQRLLKDPIHQQHVRPIHQLKIAFCWERAGNSLLAQHWLQQAGDVNIVVAGRPVQGPAWLSLVRSEIAGRPFVAPVPFFAGQGPDRNGAHRGTIPLLTQPVWSQPLHTVASQHIGQLMQVWEGQQSADTLPVGTAQFPVVAGHCVVYRDFQGLTAVHAETGRPLWTYRGPVSLLRDIQPVTTPQPEGTTPDTSVLRTLYIGNSLQGMLSTDGRRVYAIEQLDSRFNSLYPQISPDGTPSVRQTNLLVAFDISTAASRAVGQSTALPPEKTGPPGQPDLATVPQATPLWQAGGLPVAPRVTVPAQSTSTVPGTTPGTTSRTSTSGVASTSTLPGTTTGTGTSVPGSAGPVGTTVVPVSLPGISSPQASLPVPRTPGLPAEAGPVAKAVAAMVNPPLLVGHYFLGPPLAVENHLYVITEFAQQLNLVCLQGATGEVLWMQALCLAPSPIANDTQRSFLACAPSYADGVVVCPTQAGVLVGVDALTGTLLWGASYDDPEQLQALISSPHNTRRRYDHPGYPSWPVIHENSIVYLPPHSQNIQCLDLHTGRLRWKAPREDQEQATALEYVATASGTTVVIVGRRQCRGLSLATGEELWSTRLRSLPSGRGVRLGANYLVPLSEGMIVALDVTTGKQQSFMLSRPETDLGTLVATQDSIINMGRQSITAYPQAGTLLNQFRNSDLANSPSPAQELQAAEFEFALGQHIPARERLREVLARGEQLDHEEPGSEVTAQAETLLREALFHDLPTAGADTAELLDELATFVRTPEQRGRYLMQRLRFEQLRGHDTAVFAAARELVLLNLKAPLAVDLDPARTVSSVVWARQALSQVRRQIEPAHLDSLTAIVRHDLQQALQHRELAKLQQLTLAYSEWRESESARLGLSRLLHEQGKTQQAELCLFEGRRSRHRDVAALATRMLCELWDEMGLYHEAALLLRELETRYAADQVADGTTGTSYVAQFPHDRMTWDAYRRLFTPDWTKYQPRITETRWSDEKLQATYNGSGMQYLPTPRLCAFDLFDKSKGTGGQLVIVDRLTGEEFPQTICIPTRYYYPVSAQQAFVGHCLPLGARGAVHGVSLLERKLIWTVTPPGLEKRGETVRLGPTGPGYCVFQCRQHLFAVDPSTGVLLWHRQDLEPMSGLMVDPYSGLIGDDRVIVIFANDRAHYTLYDTLTGEELRHGKLDVDPRQSRRVLGRRLFHVTTGHLLNPPGQDRQGANAPVDAEVPGPQRRFRVWDPLLEQPLWELPVEDLLDASLQAGVAPGTKLYTFLSGTEELAYVTRTHQLKLIDFRTGRTNVDVQLSPEQTQNLGYLRFFSDEERYYVNLQRVAYENGPQTSFIASDATLPSAHLQGDVYAINRETQQIEWHRPFGNRTVLQLSEFRLPVLVTLCRVRQGNQLTLQLEVIDSRTGDVLAVHDKLLSDRLLQYFYDAEQGRLSLRGGRTTIHIHWSAEHTLPPPQENDFSTPRPSPRVSR